MSKFVYRGSDRTAETIVRKSKQGGGAYDSWLSPDVQLYKSKEGECTVRIMPATWADTDKWGDNWDIGTYIHYNVGSDKAAYLCLSKMKDEPCPPCEARDQTADDDERKALAASFRPLCYVIDRDDEKAGPQAWSMPLKSLFQEINARSVDKKTRAPILIDHPDEGFDVIFNRKGQGLTTDYTAVEVSRDPSPLHDDPKIQKRWLDYIEAHPLPDILNYYDEDHIRKTLFGRVDRRTQEAAEEVDESPPPRSRRTAPEPEPEDDPITSRRSGVKHTAAKPAPEPEVEDDDLPFEPDPAPRRSARRALLDDGEEAPEVDSTVASARRSLERLKPNRRAS